MLIKYINLKPNSELVELKDFSPYKALLIIDGDVNSEWQTKVSSWLIDTGCLYMMAWGKVASSWDDSVDMANLAKYDFEDIPEDHFVMTTWHEEELEEAMSFAKSCASHPSVDLENTLLLHISSEEKKDRLLGLYDSVN